MSDKSLNQTLYDYWRFSIKYKSFILANIFIFTIATFIISNMMPKAFTSTSILLAPQNGANSGIQSKTNIPIFSLNGIFGDAVDGKSLNA